MQFLECLIFILQPKLNNILVISFGVTLVVYLCFLKPKNERRIKLPGPTSLPMLGNLLQIGFRPHIKFTKWSKRYGPIYRIKLGFQDTVVVNDYKLIKELFSNSASTGRMGDNAVVMEFTKGPYGLINSSGPTWVAQRKFTIQTLHSLGFGKASMETVFLDEIQHFLNWLKKEEGNSISGTRIFIAPVVNSLWRILSGERCEWENGKTAILDAVETFYNELLNVSCNGVFLVPFLRHIAPNYFGWNKYVKSINTMLKIFQKSIENHKEAFNSAELRDYIDHYMFVSKNASDPKSSFYRNSGHANMIANIFGLFLGGTTTLPDTLSWTLLYLSENLKIQKSIQKEINGKIGSTLPSLSNRVNMPYCEAVISEILRITSSAPLTVPHTTTSDLEFHDYFISTGTPLIANLYAVHYDPEIWGDPESFRPERFLNEDKTKFVQKEALIPFGEGKRKCIGDTFVKDTLFLFITSIFQRYNILPDPNNKENADFEPGLGFILGPKPFKVFISSRKC